MRVTRIILLFFLLFGCQSRDILPKRTGKEYVPIRVGAFWEYVVTETTISAVDGQVNVLSELRFDVIDSLINAGEATYILEQKTRAAGATDWTVGETWSVRINEFQRVQQEGNIPYLKMLFPLSEGKSWDGNALNNLGGTDACPDGTFTCDNYIVADLNKPFEIPGTLSYDDSVTILENNEDDPIVMKDVRKSVYARDIGVVYREETRLEYCTVGLCIGEQIVENGRIYKQTLTAHGNL